MSYNIYNKSADALKVTAGRNANSISKVITRVLSSGQTTIEVTDETLSSESVVDIYTDHYGLVPTSVTQSGNTLTITFAPQSEDIKVKVTIGLHAYMGSVADTLEEVLDSPTAGKPCGSQALEQMASYSTEEVAIGKWIDGRTIYRRVFYFDSISATTTSVNVTLETNQNIDFLVGSNSGFFNGVNYHNIHNHPNTTYLKPSLLDGNFAYTKKGEGNTLTKCFIVFEYVKKVGE